MQYKSTECRLQINANGHANGLQTDKYVKLLNKTYIDGKKAQKWPQKGVDKALCNRANRGYLHA